MNCHLHRLFDRRGREGPEVPHLHVLPREFGVRRLVLHRGFPDTGPAPPPFGGTARFPTDSRIEIEADADALFGDETVTVEAPELSEAKARWREKAIAATSRQSNQWPHDLRLCRRFEAFEPSLEVRARRLLVQGDWSDFHSRPTRGLGGRHDEDQEYHIYDSLYPPFGYVDSFAPGTIGGGGGVPQRAPAPADVDRDLVGQLPFTDCDTNLVAIFGTITLVVRAVHPDDRHSRAQSSTPGRSPSAGPEMVPAVVAQPFGWESRSQCLAVRTQGGSDSTMTLEKPLPSKPAAE